MPGRTGRLRGSGPPPRGIYSTLRRGQDGLRTTGARSTCARPIRVRDAQDERRDSSRPPSAASSSTRSSRRSWASTTSIMDKQGASRNWSPSASRKLDNEAHRRNRRPHQERRLPLRHRSPASPSPSTTSACPTRRTGCLDEADTQIDEIDEQFQMGLITEDERYDQAVTIWRDTTDKVAEGHPGAPAGVRRRLHHGRLRRQG